MAGRFPILGIDLCEHTSSLRDQNWRPDYVSVFFNVIKWERVNETRLAANR